VQIRTQLEGVEETLLIPLWARAVETRRPDGIVDDPRAVALLEQIDYDFSKFDNDWRAQLAVAVRTEILDQAVSAFLAAHPNGLIINLAAGLDTRFYRLDNGRMLWVDVDLPNSMALRKTFMQETDRHTFVTGSVLEEAWAEAIAPLAAGRRVLIVIEGLSFYLDEDEMRGLFTRMLHHFPGAEVVLEAFGTFATRNTWLFRSVSQTDAVFKWGLDHGRDLARLHPAVRCLAEWYYLDRHPARWGVSSWGRHVPAIKRMFKIVHAQLGPPPG